MGGPSDRHTIAVQRALLSTLGLVVLVAMLGACGGSGGDKTLSKGEYADAVTRLCATNARQLQRLVLSGGGDFLARRGDEFLLVANKNIARLERLRPPPELESKARLLVADARATRDKLVALIRLAKKRPGVDLGTGTLIDSRRRMIAVASSIGAIC